MISIAHPPTERGAAAARHKGAEGLRTPSSHSRRERAGVDNGSDMRGDVTPYSAGGISDICSPNSSIDSATLTDGPLRTSILDHHQASGLTFSFPRAPVCDDQGHRGSNMSRRCLPAHIREAQETMLRKREANAAALREARRALETAQLQERKCAL
ncbi:hypothetical protein STCU_11372 [Strigomonas culicis]|uniref:Uncharacterized protein n=1 Tax=Strigomonas culicis TaxID=28005 RepID=S9TIZ6_9TRYP|nr:hypothetical protein STCU_11372 [Strigomonas culicis]|eukprot:EPY16353.1 hypothetical protein STCU_11372 [Strigomonas culicis]